MILADFSGIVIPAAVDYHRQTKEQIDVSLLRHLALNSLLNAKDKVTKYADETVLCIDGKNYWRKEVFPLYKQNRKHNQKVDSFDWDQFHDAFNQIKLEFKAVLPYKYIEVEGAEADDIMGVLATAYGPSRDVVILSSDHDMLQVSKHLCTRVKQYSPSLRKFIHGGITPYNLFEHIVKGDSGDGIPNIFSDDDTFIDEKKRQKPVKTADLLEWEKTGIRAPEVFCKTEEELRKLIRNQTLVDLTFIPEELKKKIMLEYAMTAAPRGKIFGYLIENKLKKIMERGNF